ncbi:MAG TPA: VanZ family protein [Verrucomicrobiae bacterium]|nr:VanZ family protein [Verrucomicrobiae bacterium]
MIWMAVIFSASGDRQSFNRSSRIIGPFLQWFFPGIPDENMSRVVTFVRKCAHLTEYAVLAILFWRAITEPRWREKIPWSSRTAWAAVAFVAVYAASDEFHQSLVPGRQGQFSDVVLDTIGGCAGMGIVWMITCARARVIRERAA